jgi:hypothetical protein
MSVIHDITVVTSVLERMVEDPLVLEMMRRVVEERYGLATVHHISELCALDRSAEDPLVLELMRRIVEERCGFTVMRPRLAPLKKGRRPPFEPMLVGLQMAKEFGY